MESLDNFLWPDVRLALDHVQSGATMNRVVAMVRGRNYGAYKKLLAGLAPSDRITVCTQANELFTQGIFDLRDEASNLLLIEAPAQMDLMVGPWMIFCHMLNRLPHSSLHTVIPLTVVDTDFSFTRSEKDRDYNNKKGPILAIIQSIRRGIPVLLVNEGIIFDVVADFIEYLKDNKDPCQLERFIMPEDFIKA